MSPLDWREEPISRQHDRAAFDCGEPALNEFLQRHARQSHERGAAKTFVAVSAHDGRTLWGFYSLSPASLAYARAPAIVRKGRPKNNFATAPRPLRERSGEGPDEIGSYFSAGPNGLARHDVPVFRLGRLAVARDVQGQGLGGQLLLAAGRRCLLAAREVGGLALLIDAKHDRAARWYASYGAMPLHDAPLSLLLPLSTIQRALESSEKR